MEIGSSLRDVANGGWGAGIKSLGRTEENRPWKRLDLNGPLGISWSCHKKKEEERSEQRKQHGQSRKLLKGRIWETDGERCNET